MKALVCHQLGSPLVAHGEEAPLKLVTDHKLASTLPRKHVRIHVVAASLNFADALQVQGLYQDKPKLPFVPGSEVSGVVVEVGPGVRQLKVGNKVCAVTRGGAFAEEAVVPEASVLKLPQGIDLKAAAGLPVAFGTAHVALQHRANLQPGQTVLVLGAAGGVGVASVQVSKVMSANVVAVCQGAAKAEALRRMGADAVIDTSSKPDTPLRAQIKAVAPQGVDVIVDIVGGAAFGEALKVAKWGAQILLIGFASGTIPKIAANILLVKNLTAHGVFWGSYMQNKPAVLQGSLQQLASWLAEGRIHVPIHDIFSLEEAHKAFRVLMNREVIGKVLLTPQATSHM